MSIPEPLDRLVRCLARLPGVGRRSAERMALHMVGDRGGLLREMAEALKDAAERVGICSLCGGVTAAGEDPCRLCSSPTRDGSLLCVVEDATDIVVVEKSGAFRGRYHALGGKLSPMQGYGPDDIRLKDLLARVEREGIKEVILALSTDVEGDATAGFIADMLRGRPVRVSRIAFGLPAGSGLVYADPVTLSRAFKGRTDETR